MPRSLLALSLLLASTALAVPSTLPHQGRIFDTTGSPLQGDQALTFALYDTPSGGTALWTETQAAVSFDAGYFATSLGDTSTLDSTIFEGDMLYVGLKVGTEPELSPRIPLRSVPFAFRALSADHADSADYADTAGNVTGDITPSSITIGGNTVVDASGKWVGEAPAVDVDALVSSGDLATVATTGAYSDLSGTPSLAAVATTGAYSDLTGSPNLATVATTGAYSDLTGAPTLATVATSGSYNDLDDKPAASGGKPEYFRGYLQNTAAIVSANSGYARFNERENTSSDVFEVVTNGSYGVRVKEAGTIFWAYEQDLITSSSGNYSWVRAQAGSTDNRNLISQTNGIWDAITSSGVAHMDADEVLTFQFGGNPDITAMDATTWSNLSVMWIAD